MTANATRETRSGAPSANRRAAAPTPKSRAGRGPLLWPLAAVAVGLLLLLDNFMLLGDFNAAGLWPLLLVVAGAQILLRGDIIPGAEARAFGITRGSVESGTLEVSAAGIDVELRALQKEGRLIAGQYAAAARPRLEVDGTHAHLLMRRADIPAAALADWQVALARDLPWQLYVSTHLGQVNADLSALIVQEAVIATGMGDIRVVAPQEAFGPVVLRSALGTIHVITPPGRAAVIAVQGGRLSTIRHDETRYGQAGPGLYHALDASEDVPPVEIVIHTTFGDAYLA